MFRMLEKDQNIRSDSKKLLEVLDITHLDNKLQI